MLGPHTVEAHILLHIAEDRYPLLRSLRFPEPNQVLDMPVLIRRRWAVHQPNQATFYGSRPESRSHFRRDCFNPQKISDNPYGTTWRIPLHLNLT